ncbi:MAG TPA: hypothetical protein VHF08_02020 [Nitrososphaeraceae archaeon]|nr:hypothetical protein [Nitrososphaeraceae archaeon]
MKIEYQYCWRETNIEEDMVAGGILLLYPDYSDDFIIRSAKKTTTTTKDKVECGLTKNVDENRE